MKKLLLVAFMLLGAFTTKAQILKAYVDQDISCYGNNDGYIQADVVGLQGQAIPAIYTLKKYKGNSIVQQYGTFQGLLPGTYYLTAKTSTGAIAYYLDPVTQKKSATIKLKVTEPGKLKAKFIVETFPTKSNPTGGALSLVISGGTQILQPFLVTWFKDAGNNQKVQINREEDNMSLYQEGLERGSYYVMIEDDHGCFYTGNPWKLVQKTQ